MSFRPKPSYFLWDCQICTRSASSFCGNPLNFISCYVGEIMMSCQVTAFSEFICNAFQIQGNRAQNKWLNAWEISNEVRKGWNLMVCLWMVYIEHTQKYGVKTSY